MNQKYDFVVVGAGSSGCVLAERLSANGQHTVLVIESGPADSSFLIDMPRGIGKLQAPGNPHYWWYQVKSNPDSKREESWATGRTLGGSSSVNGMIYTRGHPEDYDGWERAGCTGWGWSDIGRCMVENENHQLGAAPWRGDKGPLKITVQPEGNILCEAILDAAEQAGIPRVEDTNLAWDGGFGYQPGNIYGGKRQSASKVFLRVAASRPNVTVVHSTDVLKLHFAGNKVSGIDLRDKDGVRTVDVAREVILSAGALHSPKILQQSGIGPGELLARLGIPVLVDAPLVGKNLRDHRLMSVMYNVTTGSLNKEFGGLKLLGNVLKYLIGHTGPMTHAAHEIAGFAKTRPHLTRPDCQIGGSLFSIEKTDKGLALGKGHGMSLMGYYTQPKSQGVLQVTSSEFDAPLKIDANYMTAPEDLEAAVALLRFIRNLTSQPALAKFIVAEIFPGKAVQTEDQILQTMIEAGATTYHYAGTCQMGNDASSSVLDTHLRVRGVEGLRVADASIMPTLTSGNTNAPCMAIGRRAAELILLDTAALP